MTRNSIFESLDRLSSLADSDLVPDRLAGIHHRAQVAQRRKVTGVAAAAVVTLLGGLGAWQLLPDQQRRVEPAPSPTPEESGRVMSELISDLDADSAEERLALVMAENGKTYVRVTWGTGQVSKADALPDLEGNFVDPVDLDGDGVLDVVVSQGGGDTSVDTVFLAGDRQLAPIETVDAEGVDLALTSDGTEGSTGWRIFIGPDGVLSYRLRDAGVTKLPASVEFRTWTLTGNRLTQSADTQVGCLMADLTVVKDPC